MNQQQQRILIMIFAGLFGLLILIGVGLTIYNSQKGKVVITSIAPQDATVKLDGKDIKKGTHYIEPGKHQFVMSRAAFTEKKVDFEIKAGETKGFELYIRPVDDNAGVEWEMQNPDEASEIDGYSSREYERESQRVFTDNQILSELPIMDSTFRIDHGFSKTGRDFALYIQAADDAGKTAALETLKYLGYDPDKFEIIYTQPE